MPSWLLTENRVALLCLIIITQRLVRLRHHQGSLPTAYLVYMQSVATACWGPQCDVKQNDFLLNICKSSSSPPWDKWSLAVLYSRSTFPKNICCCQADSNMTTLSHTTMCCLAMAFPSLTCLGLASAPHDTRPQPRTSRFIIVSSFERGTYRRHICCKKKIPNQLQC